MGGQSTETTRDLFRNTVGQSYATPWHPELMDQGLNLAGGQLQGGSWMDPRMFYEHFAAPTMVNMMDTSEYGQGRSLLDAGSGWLGEGAQAAREGLDYLNPYASGYYVDQGNPHTQALVNQAESAAYNKVGGMFANAGRSFSGAHAGATATGIDEATSRVLFSDFNTQQQLQLQALQQQGQLGGLLGNLGQAGNVLAQGYDQLAMNADNARMAALGIAPQTVQYAFSPAQAFNASTLPVSSQFAMNNYWENMKEHENSSTSTSGFSDRRLKEDIEEVGTLHNGLPVYRYRFKGDRAFQIGLMADDVEKVRPEAVGERLGFKTVDYERATGA